MISIIFLSSIDLYATEKAIDKENFFNNNEIWHNLDELDNLDYSETYSYEELEYMLKENGFSNKEIISMIGEENISRSSTTIRYSLFRLETYTYNNTYKLQPRITVGLEYSGNSVSPDRIVSLKGGHVYTGDGAKCVFSGTMIYELEAGNSFYYSFYGDIYKEGDVNWSFGGEIGIGEKTSVQGQISNGSGFEKNVSESGRYYSSGLDA